MFYFAKMDAARTMCIIPVFYHIVPNADFYNKVNLLANTPNHECYGGYLHQETNIHCLFSYKNLEYYTMYI